MNGYTTQTARQPPAIQQALQLAVKKVAETTLKTEGRETQLLHKDDRGWRLVRVLYSGMPVKGKRGAFGGVKDF